MASKKKLTPTYKQMKSFLNETLINPRESYGPLAVILEQNDPRYFESRAMELVSEARQSLGEGTPTDHQLQVYEDKIKKSITLLALASLYRNNLKMEQKSSES